MIRAWAFGIVILILLDGAWVFALQFAVFSGGLLILMQISPFIAASISAYFAPRKKIYLAISMAIPAAFLILLMNFIYQLFGKDVDFPGLRGALLLFTITLIYSGILCLFGGSVGYILSKRKKK